MYTLRKAKLLLGLSLGLLSGCLQAQLEQNQAQLLGPKGPNSPQPTPTQTATPIPRPTITPTPKDDSEIRVSPPPRPSPIPTPTPEPTPLRPANLAQGLLAHYAFENNIQSHDGRFNGSPNGFSDLVYFKEGSRVTGYFTYFGIGLESPPRVYIKNQPALEITQNLTFSVWYQIHTEQSVDIARPLLAHEGIDTMPFAFYWTPGGAELILNKGTPDELWANRLKEPKLNIIKPNTWQHWVATYDGSKVKVYLNGVLDFETNYNKPLIKTPYNNIIIGQCSGMNNEKNSSYLPWIQGAMDEVRIYNRALAPEEVKQLYEFK